MTETTLSKECIGKIVEAWWDEPEQDHVDLCRDIAVAQSVVDAHLANEDAKRWRWLVRHASLGFDGAPSWGAVVRIPMFDSSDTTITALVDRARGESGDE